jgi:hypothetical protein
MEVLEGDHRRFRFDKSELLLAAGDQLRSDFPKHAPGEAWRAARVNGNRDRPEKDAAEKRRDPLGSVFSLDQNTIALLDATRIQFGRKAPRQPCETAVRGGLLAESLAADNGYLPPVFLEILEEGGQVWPLRGITRSYWHLVTPPFSMLPFLLLRSLVV